MHRIVLLFLFSIQFTDALTCLNGFTSINNKCLRLISADNTRDDVRRQCNLLGGNLVSIHTAIDNTAVAQFAFTNTDPVWIGLKCSADRTPSSCIWDDQFGNASTYSNFIAGNPAVEIGQCVYMLTMGSLRGKWFSAECGSTAMSAVCETDPIGHCSHFFNNYCYYPLGELTANEAQFSCAQNCNGSLVSIHDGYENSFLTSLFQDTSKHYARIGLQIDSSGVNLWNDGTSFNYSYIGYRNTGVGSCYSMSFVNDIVPVGKWLSSNCSSQLPSICKWYPNASCASPTVAPPQCTGPTYLTDTGSIYSPNYPYGYTATDTSPCYYILTTSTDTAAVWFDVFDLDPKSSIEFYSGIDNDTPFLTINQSTQGIVNTTILSTSSLIKMVFKPCTQNCDQSRSYKWSAKFGRKYATSSSVTNMTTNGVITSPNYPNQYLNSMTSVYLLTSLTLNRIQLHFDDFVTEPNYDIVKIYDGPNSNAPLLAPLSGDLSAYDLTYTSNSSSLYMTFSTDGSNTYRGFIARFYDYL